MVPRHTASTPRLKEAQRLKRLRSKLDLTIRELAKEFNVSHGAIAHWENGERSIPGPVLRLIQIYESGTPESRPEKI
jgi:DNA-binding transcriptional regulator YiaG